MTWTSQESGVQCLQMHYDHPGCWCQCHFEEYASKALLILVHKTAKIIIVLTYYSHNSISKVAATVHYFSVMYKSFRG